MEEKTLLEWAKLGYVLNDKAVGNRKWTNRYCQRKATYYPFNEVHLDLVKAKEIIKNKNHEYYLNAKAKKEKIKEEIKIRDNYKTKFQWLNVNRIINPNAIPITGEKLNKLHPYCATYGSSYLYYHIKDTHELISKEELENAIAMKKEYRKLV